MSSGTQRDRSVLVVEDDPDLRDLLVTLLAEQGFVAAGVEDGQRALEACVRSEPHLVILDLDLPRVSGLHFLRRHRESHACDVRVIVLTALPFTELDRVAQGVDAVFGKPFDVEELLAAVRAELAP